MKTIVGLLSTTSLSRGTDLQINAGSALNTVEDTPSTLSMGRTSFSASPPKPYASLKEAL